MDEDKDSTFFPEEIVVEILMRLPVKPLFRFKCVSKRYQFIISHPKFAQNYLHRAYSSPGSWSSSGLLSSLLFPFIDSSPDHNIQDFTNIVTTSSDRQSILLSSISIPNDDRSHRIIGSSNGLVLSVFHPDRLKFRFGLCVSNPLTKQCVQVPSSIVLTGFIGLKFGFATRREQDASAFLTYKIVIIRNAYNCLDPRVLAKPARATVEIFSSSSGSWAAQELSCPDVVLEFWAGFAYKGVLHWLDRRGSVITYDPFDSPGQFGCIELPNQSSSISSLLYSGDHEMLRYCEVVNVCNSPDDWVDSTLVWRLVNSDKGKWCLEGKFADNCLEPSSRTVMVAPNPLNRSLICIPYMREGYFWITSSWTGKWRKVRVESGISHYRECNTSSLRNPLIPIESCPWSCPFYVNPH